VQNCFLVPLDGRRTACGRVDPEGRLREVEDVDALLVALDVELGHAAAEVSVLQHLHPVLLGVGVGQRLWVAVGHLQSLVVELFFVADLELLVGVVLVLGVHRLQNLNQVFAVAVAGQLYLVHLYVPIK